MEILIDYSYRERDLAIMPLEELARFVIESEGKPAGTEVSVSFVTDEEIAELNETYRGKVGPTDVLSFECDNLDDEFCALPQTDEEFYELGDIVIAPDVAQRQTADYGTSFEGEVCLLMVHGLLHLCGYDHIEDDEAERMEARERELLEQWADKGHEAVRGIRS